MTMPDAAAAVVPDQELFLPAPAADRGLKVLVVDDDPLCSRALCRMLVKEGFTAVRALRPARIIPLARSQRLDAVLLDVRLGRADGLTVCRGLRRHAATRELPVLMMTGLSCSDDRQLQAAGLGVGEFLFKPFSSDELSAALERALAAEAPRAPAAPGGRILVVDDDPSWPEILTHWLQADGHQTLVVSEPSQLLREAGRFKPDCIVLDYLVDGRPSEPLCAQIRGTPGLDGVPVVVHSAHARAKVPMLDAGADQFVVKSGAADELLAVVRACLRRARRAAGVTVDAGVVLDIATRSLCCKGKAAVLSPRLFSLARLLIDARGTVSRQRILERLPDAAEERDHEVDVLVSRLRAVLRQEFGSEPSIETVYGEGYLWVPPSKPARP